MQEEDDNGIHFKFNPVVVYMEDVSSEKHHKELFEKGASHRASMLLEIVHMDLCGPMPI